MIELVGVLMIFSDSDDLTIFINYNNTLAAFHAAVVIHLLNGHHANLVVIVPIRKYVISFY
ncbi:hypothetical protein [Candidatus Williamhamiltonella defendens]|uniref:Uncharacterized protein n=1 Tax=Candidatus Hamiltonella defensa (Bemisia tabaci) TaxID=672795 RepID=A0A249DX42_9ENTR|nr:hypothetical protein [Candidatus Hamiltonella defensa]ASX26011.1 hypothetical protein BA171_02445 [Candidatus Hamiltonella defensa (Bemisia tabaci)]